MLLKILPIAGLPVYSYIDLIMKYYLWSLMVVLYWSCTNEVEIRLELPPDYAIDLVASEPLIFDPVDMEFDHRGRAFVLEMPGYPLMEQESRIVLLKDSNGDGEYDIRQMFSDSLGAATSLLPYRDGFLVAAPPNILFVSDRDGDEYGEYREVILGGFEVGNTQHNFNGLTYGLDNWIYGANGGNNGKPFWPDQADSSYSLRGNDFRFKINSREFQIWGESSGGFELAMDRWGRFFQTHNLTHISNLVMPAYYHGELMVDPPHALVNISDHETSSGLSRIYPIGVQETRVNHPEQSGYFSGACGITYYGGGTIADLDHTVLVADVVLNLVHRDQVINDGRGGLIARRVDSKSEFIRSSDRSFRPVNLTVGPDGYLYLLDMHRQVIEHPEWIPDEIESQMDLNAGKDKGRIYRIRLAEWTQPTTEFPLTENPIDLIGYLEHPNQWWRLTAQRLLVQMNDGNAIDPLEEMLIYGPKDVSRVHALWTLEGMGSLTDDHIIFALQDPSPEVQIQALKASESLHTCEEFRGLLLDLLSSEIASVRLQAALSIGFWTSQCNLVLDDEWYQTFANQAIVSHDQPWVLRALVLGVQNDTKPLLERILATENLPNSSNLKHFVSQLAAIGLQNGVAPNQLIALGRRYFHNQAFSEAMIRGIAQTLELGLIQTDQVAEVTGDLQALEASVSDSTLAYLWSIRQHYNLPPGDNQTKAINRALAVIVDSSYSVSERLAALRQLRFMDYPSKRNNLLELLKPMQPWILQKASLNQLSASTPAELDSILISLWPTLSPRTRTEAGNVLLYHNAYQKSLLQALNEKSINLGEINFDLERRRHLLFSDDPEIKRMASALFNDSGVITRDEALAQLQPALELSGNAAAGAQIFQEHCAGCHIKGSIGVEVGPNLTEIHRKSSKTLIHDILDPNAAVENRYLTYLVETEDGDLFSGVIIAESDHAVTIRQQGGAERLIARSKITNFKSTGQSYMPEGFENSLNNKEMADLLAYLQNMEPVP